MSKPTDNRNLLSDTPCAELSADCEKIRHTRDRDRLPTADEVIDFLDYYNAFINHARHPFEPIRGTNMKL